MEYHLDHGAFRVTAVKAACAVTVRPGWCHYDNIMAVQEPKPLIHLSGAGNEEADVVEPLAFRRRGTARGTVQGKVVITGCQVDIVGVRAPLDVHAQQPDIKLLADADILHIQRHMAHAQRRRGPLHHSAPATASTSKSCVISAVLPSMMDAEQYFSADSSTARATCFSDNPSPLTLKCA